MEENNNNEVESLDTPVMEAPVDNPVETAPEPVVAEVETKAEDVPTETVTPMPEAPVEQPVEQPTVEPTVPAPTPEEPKKEEKKGSNKLLIIVALLVLVLGGGYAVWAFVLGGNKPKTEPKKEEEQKEEEKKPEEEKSKLTEEQVKQIYNRYHTKPNEKGFVSNGSMTFEGIYAYENETFNVSEMKEITKTFADYIYDNIKEEIKDKAKPYMPEGGLAKESVYYDVEDIEPLVKREFKKLFGNNLEYNIDLFSGCHPLTTLYDNEKKTFKIPVGCGFYANHEYAFEMSSYEEKDDKLYITEKVNTRKLHADTIESESTYKWTYTKYEDTYVLSTIELVKE